MESYWGLATIASLQENYEEALSNYQQAINIAQQTLGENHPNTIQITDSYSQMLLEALTEELLKALPEEIDENYLEARRDWENQEQWNLYATFSIVKIDIFLILSNIYD